MNMKPASECTVVCHSCGSLVKCKPLAVDHLSSPHYAPYFVRNVDSCPHCSFKAGWEVFIDNGYCYYKCRHCGEFVT